MEYIGLDLSLTGTGIVKLSKEKEIIYQNVFSSSSSNMIENRILSISFDILTKTVEDCIIYIEGLSFGSRGQKMLELAGLHYYIRSQLVKDGKNVKIIPPTTLKKYITGKCNCKKE